MNQAFQETISVGALGVRFVQWRRVGATRGRRVLVLVAVALTVCLAICATAQAGVVGVPVIVDSFGNPNIPAGPFTRSVISLPAPGTSVGTPQGTFSQSNGVATMTMSGAGNAISGTTLQYTPTSGTSVDLTGGGTNQQIFIDFALIDQVPALNDLSVPGVTTYMTATDANGHVATSPSDAVGNFFAFNAAFPFTGFQGPINFTKITQLDITFVYPSGGTGGGSLDVQVNKLWATPESGTPPTPPSPTVTAPAAGAGCAVVDFTVSFTSNEGAAPVTYQPPSDIGVRAQDLAVSGTAFGGATPTVNVSGGPSTYTVAVSGMTQSGGVTLDVPEGIVDDAWAQLNTASSNDPTVPFALPVPPKFKSAADATFTVGSSSTFTADATGGSPAPTPTPQLSIPAASLPSGLSFSDSGDGTASLSGDPAAGTGGVVALPLQATNCAATVTQNLTLTIDEPPSITSAAAATFTVGALGNFAITTGHDYPAATTLSIPAGALPSGVAFHDNGDGTASISGTPAAGDGGVYTFNVTASNGITPDAVVPFTLTIDEPPSITSPAAATFTVGALGNFAITTGHDYPAAALSIPAGALPSGVAFHDNGDGTASVSGTPAAGDGGVYTFNVTASNGITPDAVVPFTLTIDEPPSITSPAAATFTVGALGNFAITTGHDYPAAALSIPAGALPSGVAFHDNGDGTASVSGTPAAGDGGVYTFNVTAANGITPDAVVPFTLTIDEPPSITSPAAATFTVGSLGDSTITMGHDYPEAALSIPAGSLPSGVAFHDNGDGTASISGTPAAGSGGVYTFNVTAANGITPDAVLPFTLTIDEPPSITSGGAATFTVGSLGDLTIATGHDYPAATALSIPPGSLPSGVGFHDNGDGTAKISGTPEAGDGGVYTFNVTASNGITPNAVQPFTLTIDEPPSITSTAAATFTVGSLGDLAITTGHNYPTAALSIPPGSLPSGVVFHDNGDGTASISGTPAAGDGGVYTFKVTAGNGITPDAVLPFTLTIDEPPSITSGGAATFTVGSLGDLTIATGHDYPAATALSIPPGSLPSGVGFHDNGDGTAKISGTPEAGDGGVYTFNVTASNGITPNAVQPFTLTIDEPPSITSTAAATFTVGSLGDLAITTGHNYPTAALSIPPGSLPSGVVFHDNGDGTAKISGTPEAGDGGVYSFNITASNGITPDAVQPFTLTINEPPSITSAAAATFTVGALGSFTITTGHDHPAATALSIPGGSLPSGVVFHDNGDGTAKISGTPAAGDGGVYSFNITASNGITPDAVQPFTLTINEPPSTTSAAAATFTVGALGSFTITTGHDHPAATALSIPGGSLPSGVVFHDNGDGTAKISGTPAAGDGGVYSFNITASNGITPDAVQPFTLTINEPPSITSAAAPSVQITSPTAGARYRRGQAVTARYRCQDGARGPGLASCAGTVAAGKPIDTSTLGPHSFTVTATSKDRQQAKRTVTYTVALPDNHFTITRVRTRRNGTVSFTLTLPGAGTADVMETAWLHDFASTAALLQPAPRRFVFARTHLDVSRRGAIAVTLTANRRGQRLVARHRHPVVIRLWVSYTPTHGTQRNIGLYALNITHRDHHRQRP